MEAIREMQIGVSNMSTMALELCSTMGINVPPLLRSPLEEQELEELSDVANET